MESTRQSQHRRAFWTVTLVLVAFSFVLKLSTWNFPHHRGDEPIYWQLSQNLASEGRYNLAGAPILKKLSPHAYDRKLFHHPPLYPALLVPFALYGSAKSAVLISWASHALCIVAVALMLRGAANFDAWSPCFWLPVLGAATDPLLTLMSTKLWLDGPLTGLIALSLALFATADRARHPRTVLAAAGVLLGLAALTKIVAVIAAPIAAVILWFRSDGNWKKFVRSAVPAFLPVAALLLPWLIVFYREYQELTPSWLKPDAWTLKNIPFVAASAAHPVSYYLIKMGMIQPLFFLGLAFGLSRTALASETYRIGLIWCLVFLAAMTALSSMSVYQMRYIGPLAPAIYVMFGGLLQCAGRRTPQLLAAGALCITYAAAGGALYLLNADYHEMFSFLEWGGIVSFEP